jgi:colanic acid/amylovoran biosynthesis glycosyltransferase
MQIAYLINQYPKVSHTFIRREIHAMETLGFDIKRVAIRPPAAIFVDEQDEIERMKTRSLLQAGAGAILLAVIKCLITRTYSLLKTFLFAYKMGRRSDRGIIIHMIYVAEACLLYFWTKLWKIKHIHAHFGTNSAAVALFCNLIGGPGYSFTSHGADEQDKPQAIGLTEKIKHSAFAVAISYFGQSHLFRWSSSVSDWQKIKIVHCGVDEKYLDVVPTPVPEVKKLVCVGRICKEKGLPVLVHAAAKVITNGTSFELVLVGDGEMRNEIEILIKSLGIEQNVRITGWASGDVVREEIINSRGMILPSFMEGLPVVIMEAFALARPVISTYVAGIPELVRPKENGWLCFASDISSLAQAIEEILSTPTADLSQMGLNGRELVLKNHDTRKEAEKLADAIRGCMSNGLN